MNRKETKFWNLLSKDYPKVKNCHTCKHVQKLNTTTYCYLPAPTWKICAESITLFRTNNPHRIKSFWEWDENNSSKEYAEIPG